MNKPKKKTKKGLPILYYVFFILLGAPLGLFFAVYEDTFTSGLRYYHLIIGLVGIFLGLLFHLVVHEAGHLLFGKMAGYSFISFRVGSFTLIKEEGKLVQKKMSIPGTGGQCLMDPPEFQKENWPYMLYNFGGSMLNLIFALLTLLYFLLPQRHLGVSFFLGGTILAGLFSALINGIPLTVGGVANDGNNAKTLYNNEEAKYAFYLQLKVNAALTQGKRLREFPLETLQLNQQANLSNYLVAATSLLEYAWYLDRLEMAKAKEALDTLWTHKRILPLSVQKEYTCEQLFMELIGECRPEVVDHLYSEDLQEHIQLSRAFPSRKRLMMAYAGFYKENFAEVKKYRDELEEVAETYAIKGDAESERAVGQWIQQQLYSETTIE